MVHDKCSLMVTSCDLSQVLITVGHTHISSVVGTHYSDIAISSYLEEKQTHCVISPQQTRS